MSDLYVHCQIGDREEDEVTVRVPFHSGETCQALLGRVAKENSAKNVAKLLSDRKYAVSFDGDAPCSDSTVIAAYPEGGDVFLIPRKGDAVTSADAAPEAEAKAVPPTAKKEPPQAIYIHFEETGRPPVTVRWEGFKLGKTRYVDILDAFSQQTGRDTSQMVCSHDGIVPMLLPGVCVLNEYPEDGDIFVLAKPSTEETKQQEGPMNWLKIADNHALNKRFVKAIEIFRLIEAQIPADQKQAFLNIKMRIGMIYMLAEQYAKAIVEFKQCVDREPYCLEYLQKLGEAYDENKQYAEAVRVFSAAIDAVSKGKVTATELQLTEFHVRAGASLYKAGEGDAAIGIVQKALGGKVECDLGLFWMSKFYLAKGQPKDALHWAVSLLVRHNSDPSAKMYKENFVNIYGKIPDELNILKTQVLVGANDKDGATAYAYLGLVCRDYGLMKQSLRLYAYSLELDPHNASHALNYCHVMENVGQHTECLAFFQEFLYKHGDVEVGGVKAKTVADMIGGIHELPKKFPAKLEELLPLRHKKRACVRKLKEGEVTLYDDPAACEKVPRGADEGESKAPEPKFSSEELDYLAIFYTVVKNLFVLGALDKIPPLLQLLVPAKESWSLHKTMIRNEAAYFGSVYVLMQYLDWTPSPSPIPTNVIYLCGDSHSFPPSHHTITLEGKPTAIVNALVTGLKCWHLRDESVFYPKRNFEAVIAGIPNGADVIFLFGEIDCREGIVMAVEKGLYETLDEAMETVAKIYLRKLVSLRKRFGRVFVHLPLPVLNVTRSLILQFHSVLKRVFAPHSKTLPLIDVSVLNEKKNALLPEFNLDSTHISPNYVPLLEAEINHIVEKSKKQ